MSRTARSVIGAICALALVVPVSAASASYLLFTYSETGPGAIDVSWDQSSNPRPIAYNYDTYATVPVLDWTGNVGPYTSITWISVVFENGGFITPDGSINVYGQQFYGFPESSPSFAPGLWTGVNATDGLPFTLTITNADIPEPSAWTMALVGLGGVGGAMRLERRRTRVEPLYALFDSPR
jgi:hypothetical protein